MRQQLKFLGEYEHNPQSLGQVGVSGESRHGMVVEGRTLGKVNNRNKPSNLKIIVN